MPKQIKNYRDLLVWQLGMRITEHVYQSTKSFPNDELYGLTSQFRRAAVSIPANIAEGHARAYRKEYKRHLSIAVGSLAEVETYVELSIRLGYRQKPALNELQQLTDQERRMLRGLQRALRSRSYPDPRPLTPDPFDAG